MNGFEKRRRRKQEAILQASLRLFQDKGSASASITAIANEAGVAASSVYNFFQTKEKLIDEVVKMVIIQDWLASLEILGASTNTETKLQAILRARIQLFKRLSWLSSEQEVDEDFLRHYIEKYAYQKYRSALSKLIAQGKREDVFASDITTDTMLAYFDILRYYFLHNPQALTTSAVKANELYTLFVRGLLKR